MKIDIFALRNQLWKTVQKLDAEMERLSTHRASAERDGDHDTAVWDKSEENFLQQIDNRLYEAINLIDERTQM